MFHLPKYNLYFLHMNAA